MDFGISVTVKILVQLPVLTQDGRDDTSVKNDFARELDFKTRIMRLILFNSYNVVFSESS